MKKILFFLLFFFYVPLSSANIIQTGNTESGDGVLFNKNVENGAIHYFTFTQLENGLVDFQVKNIYGNTIFQINGFRHNPGQFQSFDGILNLNNGKYLFFLTGIGTFGSGVGESKQNQIFCYDFINNNLCGGAGYLALIDGFSDFKRIYLEKINNEYFLMLYTNNKLRKCGFNLNTGHSGCNIEVEENPVSYFQYNNFINHYEKNYKDGVLLIKNNLNSVSAYAFTSGSKYIDLLGTISSDLFTDSRLYLYFVDLIINNRVKYIFSIIGSGNYFLEIDTSINEIFVTNEIDDEVYIGENGLSEKIFLKGNPLNFLSNKDFLFLGIYGTLWDEYTAYYNIISNQWEIIQDINLIKKYSLNDFNDLYLGIPTTPPVAGSCGFLDIGCYIKTAFDYALDVVLGPVKSIIENIKDFLSVFSDFFTTEINDFSFIPKANANLTNQINNSSLENSPAFVQGIHKFGVGIAYLVLIMAGLTLFYMIISKKNE